MVRGIVMVNAFLRGLVLTDCALEEQVIVAITKRNSSLFIFEQFFSKETLIFRVSLCRGEGIFKKDRRI
jgi:hypothetical protein